ncbi:WYL domain-containing protein [Streptomyces luteogriseus]|uniref:WYL domain-containing protein n=1 Tax=Streptomyces luteogriseus TaxID=68233 RepID=UPI0037ADCCFA
MGRRRSAGGGLTRRRTSRAGGPASRAGGSGELLSARAASAPALPARARPPHTRLHPRPLRSRQQADVWYFVADHDGEARLFRTDRALSASVLDQPAQRRDGVGPTDVWQILSRRIDDIPAPFAVTVRVPGKVLARFLRFHEPDLAAPTPAESPPETEGGGEPGWTRIELRFRSPQAAETLLAFGPDVEVLTPRISARPWPTEPPRSSRCTTPAGTPDPTSWLRTP